MNATTLKTYDRNRSATVRSLSQIWASEKWKLELHHCHSDYFTVVWITRGQGTCAINGFNRGYGAHNALVIPPNTLFSFRAMSTTQGFVLYAPKPSALFLPSQPIQLRVRDGADQAEMTGFFENLQYEAQHEPHGAPYMIDAYLQIMGIWLERKSFGQSDHMRKSRSVRLMADFCHLLCTEYQTKKAVINYASALDVTPTHLSRVAKTCSGLPAATLIQHRLLHEARRKLTETKEPIKDIATDLGFGSAAYFSRAVQKQFGLAPRSLRNS